MFYFSFSFLAFWLYDSVFMTLSYIILIREIRERERVEVVEIREYISVVFDYLLTGCWAIIGTTEKKKRK